MSSNPEFAVVDLETTGLFPRRDRVVEVAIIRLNAQGELIAQYESLVNPLRDIGPTWLHGIRASDVLNAPTWKDIAGDIVHLLTGAVIVAHNASFDRLFLAAEFDRLGSCLPDLPVFCTLHWAAKKGFGRCKLLDLCKDLGIPLGRAHCALEDARCVAAIVRSVLKTLKGDREILEHLTCSVASPDSWPRFTASRKPYPRQSTATVAAGQSWYVQQLIAKLPSTTTTEPEYAPYISLLESALEDRRLTGEEANLLVELAVDLGLSQEGMGEAHRRYLQALVAVAKQDGVITESERDDLEQVRSILSIGMHELAEMIERPADEPRTKLLPREDLAGKKICFTGELLDPDGQPVARSAVERLALERGMIVKNNVTKDLDILVTADPDSMSGKAKRARQYGTRILAAPVFWNLVCISGGVGTAGSEVGQRGPGLQAGQGPEPGG